MLRELVKGDNAFVPTAALRVAVRNGVDVAALLVTEQGRVRGDADIVFDGAPAHPSGAVRLSAGEDGTAWLETALPSVEEEITRVLVVAWTEEGALRDVRGLSVEVFGPDGATVVGYGVTDAGGETAMVLAELYRRSGGWKFRAVGQGYADGLTGLAVDHGVDVDGGPQEVPERIPTPAPAALPTPAAPAEAGAGAQGPRLTRDQILDMTPEQIRALALARRQAGAEAPDRALPAASSPPAPKPGPSDWTCGPVFEPRTVTGRDNDVITVEDLPHGPVMVELSLKGDVYTGLWPLDESNAKGRYLVNSTAKDFRGRVITSVPEHGRLRLRLEANGSWRVRVLPLAEARRLSEGRLEGWGPDVLLHTGGTADVTFHYKGDTNFIGHLYRLAGHMDPTTLPNPGRPAVNEIGARKETLPLPEGPLLVRLTAADGPWNARLKDVRPHSGGRDADGPVKLPPEPRGALGRLLRARR
ncbi:TerD family protein [Streptomyces cinereoruber]|uniref:TerD family protein n=1 Tax=Streptomyces cinereoruber TaxID=67260 RepID=UPI00363C6849